MHNRKSNFSADIGESRRLTWYAALFNEETRIQELDAQGQQVRYTEVLRPGCFSGSLAQRTNVTANLDHDDNYKFAETSNNTLMLQEDAKGLFATCWLLDNDLGNQIIADVMSGKLDGASFRFLPIDTNTNNGLVERKAVVLKDVCLTANPAYAGTINSPMVRTKDKTRFLQTKLRLAKIKLQMLYNNKY
ncbi:MAG: HK97 family phage prohead protease [Planctomycetaceae bacterium]|nr:HK97 family phage prohead protease [Planctomycetaceae bacterium]